MQFFLGFTANTITRSTKISILRRNEWCIFFSDPWNPAGSGCRWDRDRWIRIRISVKLMTRHQHCAFLFDSSSLSGRRVTTIFELLFQVKICRRGTSIPTFVSTRNANRYTFRIQNFCVAYLHTGFLLHVGRTGCYSYLRFSFFRKN